MSRINSYKNTKKSTKKIGYNLDSTNVNGFDSIIQYLVNIYKSTKKRCDEVNDISEDVFHKPFHSYMLRFDRMWINTFLFKYILISFVSIH